MARKLKNPKQVADKWFSRFIRKRDAIKRGNGEEVPCCSCGKWHNWKDMHAGHWISRRHNIVRYDEKNVHAQCCYCNRFDEGNASGYSQFMLRTYGTEVMDGLEELHWQTKQFKTFELMEIIETYKKKFKEL